MSSARCRVRALTLAVATLMLAGCGGDRTPPGEGATVRANGQADGIDVQTARTVARQYFRAVVDGRPAVMRSLLAPGPRSDASTSALTAAGSGVVSLDVTDLRPELVSEERIVLRARIEAALIGDRTGEWVEGENERWLELVHTRSGWRINSISHEPISEPSWMPVVTWTQVHVMEGQLSIDVPNAWSRRGDGWIWAPYTRGLPEVGVTWREVGSSWEPRAMLPDDGRVISTDSLALGWGPGRIFTVERPDPLEGPSVVMYEQHVVVRSPGDERAFDFFSRGRSHEELRSLAPVLRRISTSAERDTTASLSLRGRRLECPGVTGVSPESRQGRAIGRILLGQVTRHLSSALTPGEPLELERLGPIERADDWIFVQASFTGTLEPAIFVLRLSGGSYTWQGVGWSGSATEEREIREHLTRSYPNAPGALIRCADLSRWVMD
jgi:hypothetical protein